MPSEVSSNLVFSLHYFLKLGWEMHEIIKKLKKSCVNLQEVNLAALGDMGFDEKLWNWISMQAQLSV